MVRDDESCNQFSSNMLGVPVFHRILKKRDKDIFTIDAKEFTKVLEILMRFGKIIRPEEIFTDIQTVNKYILTFDDGTIDHYDFVLPFLSEKKLSGLFFICIDKIDKIGYLTKSHIKELTSFGHKIGSHSYKHINMTSLPKKEIREEVERSIKSLEQVVGEKIEWFAPPGGIYDRRVVEAARDLGIKYFRTTNFGWNNVPFPKRTCPNELTLQLHKNY